jgi:hypothetical protein
MGIFCSINFVAHDSTADLLSRMFREIAGRLDRREF